MSLWDFISHLVWPGVAVFLALLFRKGVTDALRRIQEAKGPGGWQATFQTSSQPSIPQPNSNDVTLLPAELRLGRRVDGNVTLNWSNTGNIYWLGHDLFVCYVNFLTGAEKRRLLYDLRQCLHHLASLVMTEKGIEERLRQMVERVTGMLETDLTKAVRQDFARDLLLVRDEVGAHMERHQPNFRPGPWQLGR